MTRLLVLYNPPADPAAFDRYYYATHVPLAKTLPGLLSYTVSANPPANMAGDLRPHLVAELDFESAASLQAAMESPEGQVTAGDLANFAQAGVTLLTFDVSPV